MSTQRSDIGLTHHLIIDSSNTAYINDCEWEKKVYGVDPNPSPCHRGRGCTIGLSAHLMRVVPNAAVIYTIYKSILRWSAILR
jgi:hypothetical protein